MIKPKRLLSACLLWPLLTPASVSALVVDIQGIHLEPDIIGARCIEIGGTYAGVRIEGSVSGQTPRICFHTSSKMNYVIIEHSTFVASPPIRKDIVIKFEHDFPPGINGKIMTRARVQGFFSTSNGVGVPSGDRLSFAAFFSQQGHKDAIAEPFDMTVGDEIDSAIFEYSVKEPLLISGPRSLIGILKINFDSAGHQLTVTERSGVAVDSGSTMADKLDLMGQQPEEEEEDTKKKPSPVSPEGPKQNLPAKKPQQPIPFPSQSGN
jgi:hypothetical protein